MFRKDLFHWQTDVLAQYRKKFFCGNGDELVGYGIIHANGVGKRKVHDDWEGIGIMYFIMPLSTQDYH